MTLRLDVADPDASFPMCHHPSFLLVVLLTVSSFYLSTRRFSDKVSLGIAGGVLIRGSKVA